MHDSRIETFLLISETRNITDASAKLYLSQSTISTRLKQLEDYLGYELCIRQKGQSKIELTEEGERFLLLANEYMKLTKNMRDGSIKSNKVHIKLAATNSILQSILFRYIGFIEGKYKNIFFETRTRHSVEIFDDIYEEKIDIGVSLKEFKYSGIETIKLVEIPFLIFRIKDGEEVKKPNLMSLDIKNYIYIPRGYEIDEFIANNFSDQTEFHRSTDSVTSTFLILKEGQWLIAPKSFIDLIPKGVDLEYFNSDKLPNYKIYLVYKKEKYEKQKKIRDHVNGLINFYTEYYK